MCWKSHDLLRVSSFPPRRTYAYEERRIETGGRGTRESARRDEGEEEVKVGAEEDEVAHAGLLIGDVGETNNNNDNNSKKKKKEREREREREKREMCYYHYYQIELN